MRFLVTYRWIILAFVLGSCFYGAIHIPTALQPNNDLEAWFNKSDPALQAYYSFQEEFGNDRIISVAIKEKESVLTPACLEKIKRLQNKLEKIVGVNKVTSIVNAKDFRKFITGQSLQMQFVPWFNDRLDKLEPTVEQELLNSSLYSNRLINAKGDITLVVIEFQSFDLVHKRMDKIIPEIQKACNDELGSENVHLSGADIITFGLNELSRKDFIKFTGLSYLLMFVMIALFYRRTVYVVSSFLIAFTSLWLTFSIYGFLGFGLNIFTVMTPTLVIIISMMMSMHIFNEFENSPSTAFENAHEKVIHCLKTMVKPCLYATLTTMIGFLSLLSSSIAVTKEFGWLTATGCFLAFLLAFAWCSIILPYVGVREKDVNQIHKLGLALRSFTNFVLRKSPLFFGISLIVIIIAFLGIRLINKDMNPIEYLPANHSIVQDHYFMESNWGDYYPIDVVLETNGSLEIDDVAIIQSMIDFDEQMVEQKLARNTFSYVQGMDRFARVRYGKSLKELLKTPLIMNSFKRSFNRLVENETVSFVTEDHKKARITIIGSLQSVRVLEASIAKMNEISKNTFKESASLQVVGYPALYVRIMHSAFDSMKSSLLVALFLVLFAMLILLRSLKIAIIALFVNLFPVLIMLGFLGICQINLDIATCTIAAIILGIAIDDTIHILYRYQEERKNGASTAQALKVTHFQVGRVVVVTSIVFFAGFSILLLASLKTVFYFGLLSIISVVAILYGDMILLSILLKKWDKNAPS